MPDTPLSPNPSTHSVAVPLNSNLNDAAKPPPVGGRPLAFRRPHSYFVSKPTSSFYGALPPPRPMSVIDSSATLMNGISDFGNEALPPLATRLGLTSMGSHADVARSSSPTVTAAETTPAVSATSTRLPLTVEINRTYGNTSRLHSRQASNGSVVSGITHFSIAESICSAFGINRTPQAGCIDYSAIPLSVLHLSDTITMDTPISFHLWNWCHADDWVDPTTIPADNISGDTYRQTNNEGAGSDTEAQLSPSSAETPSIKAQVKYAGGLFRQYDDMVRDNWIRAYEPRRVENLADAHQDVNGTATNEKHGAWGKLALSRNDAGKYGSVKSLMSFGKGHGGKKVGFTTVVEVTSADLPLQATKAVARYFVQGNEIQVKVRVGSQERSTVVAKSQAKGKEMVADFKEGFLFDAPPDHVRLAHFSMNAAITVVGFPNNSRSRGSRFFSRLMSGGGVGGSADKYQSTQAQEVVVGSFIVNKRVEANKKIPDGGHLINGGRKVKDVVVRLQIGVVLDEERQPVVASEGVKASNGLEDGITPQEQEEGDEGDFEANIPHYEGFINVFNHKFHKQKRCWAFVRRDGFKFCDIDYRENRVLCSVPLEDLVAISKPSGVDLDFMGGHPGIIFRFSRSRNTFRSSVSPAVHRRPQMPTESLGSESDFDDDFSASQRAEWLDQIISDDKMYIFAESKEKAHEWAWAVSKWCPRSVLPEGYEEDFDTSSVGGDPQVLVDSMTSHSQLTQEQVQHGRNGSPYAQVLAALHTASQADDALECLDDELTPRASPHISRAASPPPIHVGLVSPKKEGSNDNEVLPSGVAVECFGVSRPVGAGVPQC
ncbi:hypothetical protein HDU93_003490 [Gonapodya sp. JEL0774]|nr:hypothetical protein HDU93_003490 [Gonapodya sp. JEL0774]